jgi:hypothetical protein
MSLQNILIFFGEIFMSLQNILIFFWLNFYFFAKLLSLLGLIFISLQNFYLFLAKFLFLCKIFISS